MGKLRSVAVAAACLQLFTANVAAAQEDCWEEQEIQAARVRDLQTLLMVGALQCRNNSGYDIHASYNEFVKRHRPTLVNANKILKARFMRTAGIEGGAEAYNEFTTQLANEHSTDATDANFCSSIEALTRLTATAKANELALIGANLADLPAGVGASCPARVAVADPADTSDEPELLPASAGAATAAAAKPSAPTAGTPQSSAMDAAIAALQSATAALQAAMQAQRAAPAADEPEPVVAETITE